ncbi:MAG: glutamate--tRNA ligase [candidate division WOR-3 bacterium]
MADDTTVRVRIAPSPTGALHLGLVRTALYNWLFARQHKGRFILRIDDTDPVRNREEMLEPILRGLRWLGIDWDEGPEVGGPHAPYFQSQRTERYRQVVTELLERGAAYYDYATPEEIAEERKAAQAEKRLFLYSRRWMAETKEQAHRFEAEGRKPAVRLKMPREGRLVIDDLVRGRVEFEWQREQDQVIQRADGTFLYHLATVVDDHDFAISHVIRAEEHLSNTPRQVFIFQALGWPVPRFAHLPVVAEPGSRQKLSKRKMEKYLKNPDFAELVERGAKIARAIGLKTSPEVFNPVMVEFYERVGFLPQALVNYLALLGWSLDDRTEFFTREELLRSFSLERVIGAAASFDPKKLMAFQVHYMLELGLDEKVALVLPYLVKAGLVHSPPNPRETELTRKIVEAAGDRIKVAGDIVDYQEFYIEDDRLSYDRAARAEWLGSAQQLKMVALFKERLSQMARFDRQELERLIADISAAEGVKTGELAQTLRVAVTGKAIGFGLADTMAILGRERCLARLSRALETKLT